MILNELRPWLEPAGLFLVATASGLLVKLVLLRRLHAFFEKTDHRYNELFLEGLSRHLPFWVILAGLAAAVQASPLSSDHQFLIHRLVVSALFISFTLAASRFLGRATRLAGARFTASEAATNLAEDMVRVGVVAMGAMLLLQNLGISITPILTALGVGSLAVALGLQDTLSNFFAGIHIVANRLVEVGEYVKLDSGQEVFLVDVGWRATRLRELADNLIVVPNSKLAQSIIVNYSRPGRELAVVVPLIAAYETDLARLEALALDVAREVQKTVPGGVSRFEPLFRLTAMTDSAVNGAVILRAQSFPDRFLMIHEFIKRLHARCLKEGLTMTVPSHVVHLAR